jgi:uncharacterized OsmC-like protein
VPARAKEFRYAVDLLEGGAVRTEDGVPLGEGPEWTPEHLVLAGLIRCSLESLRFHARRGGIEVAGATGSARAMVTKRESDERYAMVEAEVALDVRLRPSPGEDELAELLAKAERDCFVGASLTVKPTYRWTAV